MSDVRFDVDGRVGIITIDRPGKRNCLDRDSAHTFASLVTGIEDDDDLWAGIIAGEGGVFCSGADLKSIAAEGFGWVLEPEGHFAGMTRRRRRKVFIAAVDGLAFGGGCEIAIACDLVVASTASSFAVPEVKRGILAASNAGVVLPRVLPRNVAMWMLTTGDALSAADAHRYGMVNELVEPGQAVAAAKRLAATITANAPVAVRCSRELVVVADDLTVEQHFERADELIDVVTATKDNHEGMLAFVEKRAPVWTGH